MKHLVFFIVDSVRNYVTGEDDRDKIQFMFDFAAESCEFSKMVSSAPSSIMAVSAMMTGIPAYFIGRNYEDFKYDNGAFISLTDILRDAGYKDYSVMNARETREKFSNLFNVVGRDCYPRGLTHAQKNWSNREVNLVLERLLERDFDGPSFFLIYYNVRLDPETSAEVERGYRMFKEKGLLDDGVFVMTSDHGYIDPQRGYTPEKLKELGLSHDLVMTDDNIVVPFYLTYPSCPVKRVDATVSNLDVLPTLLDILGLHYPEETKLLRPMGRSLLPYIETDDRPPERLIRSDARFLFQKNRVTVIRGDRYKYIQHHDTGKEEFFDLQEDAFEEKDLVGPEGNITHEAFDLFAGEFRRLESQALDFQNQYLLEKFARQISKASRGKACPEICLILLGARRYRQMFIDGLNKLLPAARISCMQLNDEEQVKYPDAILFAAGHDAIADAFSGLKKMRFDAVLIAADVSSHELMAPLKQLAAGLKARQVITFDVNMDAGPAGQKKPWFHIFRILKRRWRTYVTEPRSLWADLVRAVRYGRTVLIRRTKAKGNTQ